jgi:hypothetical protein
MAMICSTRTKPGLRVLLLRLIPILVLACLALGVTATVALAVPSAPVISGPTSVQFIYHPRGFRGAIGWDAVPSAVSYRIYDADTSMWISTVATPTYMVYGLQGVVYRRYVVAVDSAGDTSPPSNTIDIQETAAVAPAAPAGFDVLPTSVFDLSTSAPPSGKSVVKVPYDSAEVIGDPADLRLLHYTGGAWEDISTSVDTVNKYVIGETSSFSVFAVFSVDTRTLTYSHSAGGSIDGSATQVVPYGSDGTTVTATPDVGYRFVKWSDGVLTALRCDKNVTADQAVSATFAINTYTLDYAAHAVGSIVGSATQVVEYGGSGTEVTAAAIPGYHFYAWDDGVMTASRTDTNVAGDVIVTAFFAIDRLTLNYSSGPGGSIDGSATQVVYYGADGTTVTAVPDDGYHFVSWSDGLATAARTDLDVTADASVTATFEADAHEIIPTSLTKPTVLPSSPRHGTPAVFGASLSPGAAAVSGTTTLYLWRYETKTVKRLVHHKRKSVRVGYWRPRATLTMAGDSSGQRTASYRLGYAGTWKMRAEFAGSPDYAASKSQTTVFRVR